MIHLVGVLTAAAALQRFCDQQDWRSCLIGGIAVQRWGEPRFTQDVDVTLLTGLGEEERFVDTLLQELAPRRPDAREFALRHRVLLAQTRGGVSVDIALAALPFEERCVARASDWRFEAKTFLRTCSAEDLVVHKTFAGREIDWSDVERVIARQHGKLDWDQIVAELEPLLELKGAIEAMDRLLEVRALVERRLRTQRT
jgi:hypothetical protein